MGENRLDILNVEKAYTHAGKFHADDVFATALIRLVNPKISISRVTKVSESMGNNELAYDIGRGKFDHHQPDAEIRPNGTPYAAFGLLWRELGNRIVSEESAALFDRQFVQVIDLCDNSSQTSPMYMAIDAFVPHWDSDDSPETLTFAFWDAVQFAEDVLRREFDRMRSADRAAHIVNEKLIESSDGIVVLDRFMPFDSIIGKAKFLVYPSRRGGYTAQALRANSDADAELICPFPDMWRGADAQTLSQRILNQDSGITFCHNSGFMISATSKENAITACYRAMGLKLS